MKKVLLSIAISLFAFGIAAAQDTQSASHNVTINIPNVAVVDIEGASTDITLGATFSGEAGDALGFADTDNSLWLNYTSVVPSSSTTRTISAKIESGSLPAGVKLKVAAGAPTGGAGTKGSSVGSAIELSTTDQPLITGIGSCYTGNGANNGSNLTYSLELQANGFANLISTSTTVQVTYTIADN